MNKLKTEDAYIIASSNRSLWINGVQAAQRLSDAIATLQSLHMPMPRFRKPTESEQSQKYEG